MLSNVKALQLFQLLRQGAAILISILFTKNLLPTQEIGTYEMLIYIGTTLSFFWVSGFLQGMLPIYPKLQPNKQARFFFMAYLLYTGLSLLLAGLLWFGQSWIIQAMVGQESLPYFGLFCLYLLFNLPSFLVEYIYLLKNQGTKIVSFGVFAFGGQVVAVLLPLLWGYGLEQSFQCLVYLALAKHLWLAILLWKYAVAKLETSLFREYLVLSLPLVAYAFLAGFASFLDQWLVAWYYEGDEELFAVFRYGARELPLATALSAAFSAALIPEISKDPDQGIKSLRQKSLKLFHILFPLTIFILLISEWAFPLVFNPDFQESAFVFNIYLLALASRLMFPQTILIARKETGIILKVSIIEVLLNIVLSYLFIQYWGLLGVAYATVLVFLAEKIMLAGYLWNRYQLGLHQYTRLDWFFVYSGLLLIVYLWVSY